MFSKAFHQNMTLDYILQNNHNIHVHWNHDCNHDWWLVWCLCSHLYCLTSLPCFCFSVCAQYDTQKQKSNKKWERPGSTYHMNDVWWTWGGHIGREGSTLKWHTRLHQTFMRLSVFDFTSKKLALWSLHMSLHTHYYHFYSMLFKFKDLVAKHGTSSKCMCRQMLYITTVG